jgi:hypothetical protein
MKLPAVDVRQGLKARNSIDGHQINELMSSDAHTLKLVNLTQLISKIQQQIKDLNRDK